METNAPQELLTAYKDCLTANVSLKYISNKKIKRFKISSLVEPDGVIFEINDEKKYAVIINNEVCENGDLTITKYLNCLQQLIEPGVECKLILYSDQNITTKHVRMVVDDERFLAEVVTSRPDEILYKSQCYKFRLVENCIGADELTEYERFFDSFFLYTKESTLEDLKERVAEQIQKRFARDVSVAHRYINFISEWSKLQKQRPLTKQLLWHIIDPSTRTWDMTDDENYTTFHIVCREGDKEAVDLLLKYGADVNVLSRIGWTPIHLAAKNGDCAIIQKLMVYNANVNSSNSENTTPLHVAAEEGHFHAVLLLLKLGAKVNATNTYGWTALHFASLEGHYDIVEALIRFGANVSITDNHGWTALHLASDRGHVDVVTKLVNCGIDVNAGMYTGTTALIFACAWGHEGVVRVLVEARARINMVDDIGLSPLGSAFYNKHDAIVSLLMDAGAEMVYIKRSRPPIYVNCFMGYKESLRRQINMGIDINAAVNDDYWRPLHVACSRGREIIVEMLLEAGADVFATTDDGKTPIAIASESGYVNIVRIIDNFIQRKCKIEEAK